MQTGCGRTALGGSPECLRETPGLERYRIPRTSLLPPINRSQSGRSAFATGTTTGMSADSFGDLAAKPLARSLLVAETVHKEHVRSALDGLAQLDRGIGEPRGIEAAATRWQYLRRKGSRSRGHRSV